jgi:hypothetical protein
MSVYLEGATDVPQSKPGKRIMWRHDRPEPDEDTIGPTEPLRGADLVDTNDPAYGFICRAAMELVRYGFDPADPDIATRAIEVGRQMYEQDSPSALAQRLAAEHGSMPPPRARPEFVYYMRIGNRIKIGWTTNLTERLKAINPEELVATEEGGRKLEKRRHSQFADLRTHGEWFRMDEPLIGHLVALNQRTKKIA